MPGLSKHLFSESQLCSALLYRPIKITSTRTQTSHTAILTGSSRPNRRKKVKHVTVRVNETTNVNETMGRVTFSEVGGLGCTNDLTPVCHAMVRYGQMAKAGVYDPPNPPVTPLMNEIFPRFLSDRFSSFPVLGINSRRSLGGRLWFNHRFS